MGIYVYPNNTETEITNAYIGIPNPESITLDKSSINLTTVGQTEQLTATIEPTISDHSITWTTSDSTVATVSTTGLVTCVTPGTATITATTSNGLTATCGVVNATSLFYDFTQSDAGWTYSSANIQRNSDGFYQRGTWTENFIFGPSAIISNTPSKITIIYKKTANSCTLRVGDAGSGYAVAPSYDYSYLNNFGTYYNGSWSNLGSIGNLQGVVTWEMEIDSSTTPRTVKHTFTGVSPITETSGVLDWCWTNNVFKLSLVTWNNEQSLYIQSAEIEF